MTLFKFMTVDENAGGPSSTRPKWLHWTSLPQHKVLSPRTEGSPMKGMTLEKKSNPDVTLCPYGYFVKEGGKKGCPTKLLI